MNELQSAIEQVLGVTDVHLEHPNDVSHGDFATNIAMVTAKKEGQNPRELAQRYVEQLRDAQLPHVDNIEIAGPGFINFYMDRAFFVNGVRGVVAAGETYGSNTNLVGQKYIFEYTDPNPFKQFHIGHLMSNTIGESFSRLAEWSGADVKRVTYQGDVGMHVAAAIWGMQKMSDISTVGELGAAYAAGATALKESAEAKSEIETINKKVYAQTDEIINGLYAKGRTLSLDYFDVMYKRLGSHFDHNFFESESAPIGKELVEEHSDVFTESDGAIVYEGEKHGLHTRVFINAQGIPTYEAKELGLAKLKNEHSVTRNYDVSVVVTGNEINEYFKVLLAAMTEVLPELAAKTVHQSHGMLRLPSGKMSSRTGEVITAESLLDETKARALDVMHEADEQVAEQVAVAALKYAILRQSPGKDIIFNSEQALSFEGDSGPYLQYTCVRAQSVLAKAADHGVQPSTENVPAETNAIERLLYQFPEVVELATQEYAPHHVVSYLTELASAYNSFYAQTKIIDADNSHADYHLALTAAVSHILTNGFSILGITVPDRM